MTKTRHPHGSARFFRWASFVLLSSFVIWHSSFHLAAANGNAADQATSAVETVLRDPVRGKDIPLFVACPKSEEKCPVILFSHGAGGSGAMYDALLRFWADKGYVVIAPTHADSVKPGGNWGEVVRKALTDTEGMISRVDDLRFLIGALADLEKQTPLLKGRVDASRIGIAGHSQGAYTTMLLAGATVSLPKRAAGENFLDEKPGAFLLLSPPGISPAGDLRGLAENSWRNTTRPMMTVTGTRDFNSTGEGADWRLETFRRAAPGDKFGMNLPGASHLTFTGQPAQGKGPGAPRTAEALAEEQRVFASAQQATLAFWDATLKADAKAREWLKSASLTQAHAPAGTAVSGASLAEITLVARDAERAAQFYSRLLGVESSPVKNPIAASSVRILPVGNAGLRIIGSRTATPVTRGEVADALGYRMLTVVVTDIDAAAKRLSDAGWPAPTVRTFAPGVRFAVTRDPEGNLVELGGYEPTLAARLGIAQPGVTVGLNVSDAARAGTFYSQTLGLTAQPTRASPNGMRHSFTAGGGTIKFWESSRTLPRNSSPIEAACGLRAIALTVADLEGAFVRMKNAGAKILTPPDGTTTTNRAFTIADSDGNAVEIREAAPFTR